MIRFRDALRYVFFPDADRCPLCGAEGARGLCGACEKNLSGLLIEAEQPRDRISLYYHEGVARDAVLDLKFRNKRYLSRFIARELLKRIPSDADVITAVPLHVSRRRKRGYNQSELIGRELSGLCKIPYTELLTRTRRTFEQAKLTEHEQRKKNVRGAFKETDREGITGKRILLIDDVITTGATSEECIRALKSAGAADVTAISFTAPR